MCIYCICYFHIFITLIQLHHHQQPEPLKQCRTDIIYTKIPNLLSEWTARTESPQSRECVMVQFLFKPVNRTHLSGKGASERTSVAMIIWLCLISPFCPIGKCFRLYPRERQLPAQIPPRIVESDITSTVLFLKRMEIAGLGHCDFIDRPGKI